MSALVSASAYPSEVSATLSGEIRRCVSRATYHAELLESIAAEASEVTCDIFREDDSEKLLQRSRRLRGVVGHALAVLAELQCVAGELGALGTLRSAEEVEETNVRELPKRTSRARRKTARPRHR